MHKFFVRTASGIIYAAIIVFAILYGGWALWILAIAFSCIGVCELDHMAVKFSKKTLPIYILDILSTLSLICIVICRWSVILCILFYIIRTILNLHMLKKEEIDRPLPGLAPIYLGLPFACMIAEPIHRMPLLIFVMLWLNDSGAYIVGSLMGKRKMSPKISPKKTWEGLIGGIIITILGSLAIFKFCPAFFGMEYYGIWVWMTLAISTCVFGTLGDLLESKLKRLYGFKDSGNWIPGHGGLLDRIDSFIIAYPVAFILMIFI